MNVLFVGNSYTFYGDVPGQVRELSRAHPRLDLIETDRVAQGGASLALHAEETGAFERVAEAQWTHVVLQEKSTGTLHDAADYHRFVRALGERVRGQVLLYETWARQVGHEIYRWGWSGKRPSTMRRRVRAELDAAARDLGAQVVPVGTAWELCLERYPKMVLHDDDGHHASTLGSHLAACVFFAWLADVDPGGIDFLPPDVALEPARRLRSVAWHVVRSAR